MDGVLCTPRSVTERGFHVSSMRSEALKFVALILSYDQEFLLLRTARGPKDKKSATEWPFIMGMRKKIRSRAALRFETCSKHVLA